MNTATKAERLRERLRAEHRKRAEIRETYQGQRAKRELRATLGDSEGFADVYVCVSCEYAFLTTSDVYGVQCPRAGCGRNISGLVHVDVIPGWRPCVECGTSHHCTPRSEAP